MDPERSTRSLVEAAFLAALTVVFCLATIYLPLLGMVTSFFWPLPIILLGVRHNLRLSILASVVAALIVGILAGPLTAISMFLGLGLLGLVLGRAMQQRRAPMVAVGTGAIALLLSTVLLFGLSFFVMGINPLESFITMFQESMESSIGLYEKFGLGGDSLSQVEDLFTESLFMLRYLLPMLLVTASLTSSFINFAMARTILGRLGVSYPGFPPFASWRLPRKTALGYVLGIGCMIISNSTGQELFRHIGLNLQAFFHWVFLAQGLSVAWHFMDEYRLAKGLRFMIVAMALFSPLLSQGLFFAGLLDLFVDFRQFRA